MANPKSKDDANRYLIQRGNVFYYQRKIPAVVRGLDRRGEKTRGTFRTSLKTSQRSVARKKRDELESADERTWGDLLAGRDAKTVWEAHAVSVRLTEALGFGFKPSEELARYATLVDIGARIDAMGPAATAPVHIEKALLGNVPKPTFTVKDAYDLYVKKLAADELVTKSENQRRKWINVKRRGVDLFIEVVGNIDMEAIDHTHGQKLWDYWQERISPTEKGKRPTHTPSSGNRDISTMRTLYGAYFKYNGQRDRPNPFAGFNFEERGPKRKRPPFPTDHITGVIMKPGALAGMNQEARGILLASIETGSRPSEIANLMPGDIRLDCPVPHIIIQPRHDPDNPREVKTDTSERTIPLIGISLEVFKNFPKGFPRYRDNEEAASAAINKYLRENKLMPSGEHTLYGFRHSLEDRMKLAGLGDDVRRMLLGHKVNREAYGTDPLEWKQKELLKIALPFDPVIVTQDRA